MGDRVPNHMMFQYIMWYEGERDRKWMSLLDSLAHQMPRGELWPKE